MMKLATIMGQELVESYIHCPWGYDDDHAFFQLKKRVYAGLFAHTFPYMLFIQRLKGSSNGQG